MNNQKATIVSVNKNEGIVGLMLPNGKTSFHLLDAKSRKFVSRLNPGEAEVSYATEVDEAGIPFISFIKNTTNAPRATNAGFRPANRAFETQKEGQDAKALTMLVSYVKDFACAMVEHAIKQNIAGDTDKIWSDAKIQVMKTYNAIELELKGNDLEVKQALGLR